MFNRALALLAIAGAASTTLAAPSPSAASEPQNQLEKRGSSGSATYYETGLGACGWTNGNNDMIVAINSDQYSSGSHCGKWLTIKNNGNGNTVAAYVADECPTCSYGSLDLSPQVFGQLNGFNYDEGMFDITWWWND